MIMIMTDLVMRCPEAYPNPQLAQPNNGVAKIAATK